MISRHGGSIGVSEMNPPTSMSTMPHTRWWMCRSPLVTLPGHHGTLGERISRALVRMKRNAPRNATNASSAGRDEAAQGSPSPREISKLIAASTGRFFQLQLCAGSRRLGSVPLASALAMAPLKQKGDLAEMLVAADLVRRGYKVALPFGEDWDYDLIVERGDRLERVQVKYTESNGAVICVRARTHSLTNGRVIAVSDTPRRSSTGWPSMTAHRIAATTFTPAQARSLRDRLRRAGSTLYLSHGGVVLTG